MRRVALVVPCCAGGTKLKTEYGRRSSSRDKSHIALHFFIRRFVATLAIIERVVVVVVVVVVVFVVVVYFAFPQPTRIHTHSHQRTIQRYYSMDAACNYLRLYGNLGRNLFPSIYLDERWCQEQVIKRCEFARRCLDDI